MCCQYYILPKSVEWDPIRELAEHARLMQRFRDAGKELILSGTVRPTDVAPVFASDRSGGQSCFPMRWGFRLPGRKDLLIQARTETAAEKPSFREAWQSHRCAVPATGYYEWSHPETEAGARRAGVKYAIRPKDQEIAWLCGLYRIEDRLPVFVILTREPSPDVAGIHDRMPLILPKTAISAWIDPCNRAEDLLPLALDGMLAERAS